MLALQARTTAPRADFGNGDRLAGDHRQCERRADNLPAALAKGTIDDYHPCVSLGVKQSLQSTLGTNPPPEVRADSWVA
jgi:hypothetical protein